MGMAHFFMPGCFAHLLLPLLEHAIADPKLDGAPLLILANKQDRVVRNATG